ncbi:MAG: hypothetical protein IKB71_00800 [Lentisphaeria bacterium]|nr:hypothetical protein [Lentisphaeria bacterium]
MPDLPAEFRHVHLIGSGGVGMFAIGGILLEQNVCISGSDLEKNPKSEFLRSKGAEIFYGHAAENLPQNTDAVVFTSAAAKDNPELLAAQKKNIPCFKRGQFLAEKIVPFYENSVAVSGSHGKTTVTAMVTHILRKCNANPGCLIGGALQNGDLPFSAGDGRYFVTEADESDYSHALLSPTVGVITNYDADHAWSKEAEAEQFVKFQQFCRNSKIVIHYDIPVLNAISEPFKNKRILLDMPDGKNDIPFAGFMKTNANLALQTVKTLGFDVTPSILADFKGVDRRMTIHGQNDRRILLEDYAHHPTELESSLKYMKELYQGYRLHVIFQPHRYARLKKYFSDFVRILNTQADKVMVAPVFAAWNESGTPTSQDLAAELANGEYLSFENDEKLHSVWASCGNEKVLTAVIGAGDVEKLIPLLQKDL